jgi:hypothetical protein
MPMFAVVMVAALQVTAQPTGSLAGCVSQANNTRIPGVTIVAKANGVQWTSATDAGGCYELRNLMPAAYRVTAHVQGFDNVTRDGVIVRAGTATHLDFPMSVSPLCECVSVQAPVTLIDAWERADAVLYVRILGPAAGITTATRYYAHRATVLDVLKQHPVGGPTAATTAVLEHQVNGAPEPLDVGQELVIFSRWVPEANGFAGIGTNCCRNPETVFVVRNGQIQSAPSELSRYVGMGIDAFLEELRALPHSR